MQKIPAWNAAERPKRVLLARHGQSILNADKRISGQCDGVLTAKGRRQAVRLARALRHEPLSAIHTSTLRRACDTAAPVAAHHGLTVQAHDALRELSHGILDGRCRDARDPEAMRLWSLRKGDRLGFRAAGGETFAELSARVVPCLNFVLAAAAGEVVLIVGHRNTNRVILGALMRWPLDAVLEIGMHGGELYEITPGRSPFFTTRKLAEAAPEPMEGRP